MTTRYIDDVYTFYAVTTRFDTGAATDADAAPAYRIYEEETGTPLLTGTMALLDSSNTAGLYSEQVTLSAANGFEVGKCYCNYKAATVNSVAGAAIETFVVRKKPLSPTTEGRELDVTAAGNAGIDWGNVESPTTSNGLTGTTIATSQVVASVSGAVGSVTGAVGSVTAGVTVTTNNDKTGYSLTQTFPTNFASMVIAGDGLVDTNVQKINDVELVGDGDGTPMDHA